MRPGGIYDRLVRLGIPTGPKRHEKPSHNARMLHVPSWCGDLAEFFGVMLGDGHIGASQIWITVNVKTDAPYIPYLQALQEHLFQFRPRVTRVKDGSYLDLYISSTQLVLELHKIRLYSSNKVKDQVGIPHRIFSDTEYQRRFVRGFFDTDGSIYLLKHFNAPQMLFKNCSRPLLDGTREILLGLGYHPSRVSDYSVYLTRHSDVDAYARAIGFGNLKHVKRAQAFRSGGGNVNKLTSRGHSVRRSN